MGNAVALRRLRAEQRERLGVEVGVLALVDRDAHVEGPQAFDQAIDAITLQAKKRRGEELKRMVQQSAAAKVKKSQRFKLGDDFDIVLDEHGNPDLDDSDMSMQDLAAADRIAEPKQTRAMAPSPAQRAQCSP